MPVRSYAAKLVLVAILLYAVCHEGYAHDQSALCVIDPFMTPAFLGFEYWSEVGIALATFASGLIIAAVRIGRDN